MPSPSSLRRWACRMAVAEPLPEAPRFPGKVRKGWAGERPWPPPPAGSGGHPELTVAGPLAHSRSSGSQAPSRNLGHPHLSPGSNPGLEGGQVHHPGDGRHRAHPRPPHMHPGKSPSGEPGTSCPETSQSAPSTRRTRLGWNPSATDSTCALSLGSGSRGKGPGSPGGSAVLTSSTSSRHRGVPGGEDVPGLQWDDPQHPDRCLRTPPHRSGGTRAFLAEEGTRFRQRSREFRGHGRHPGTVPSPPFLGHLGPGRAHLPPVPGRRCAPLRPLGVSPTMGRMS